MMFQLPTTFTIGDLRVIALKKNIKYMYLSVSSLDGEVKVTAPLRVKDEVIKQFVTSKLAWIHKEQARLQRKKQLSHKQYITGEEHFLLDKLYFLNIILTSLPPKVTLTGCYLNLYVDPLASLHQKERILYRFYRQELQKLIPDLVAKWRAIMHIQPHEVRIKKMKTKWGTCNPLAKRIWLNLALIQTPLPCVEYVFVHEMVHLFEANHGPFFYQLMDLYLPTWRVCEDMLKEFALHPC